MEAERLAPLVARSLVGSKLPELNFEHRMPPRGEQKSGVIVLPKRNTVLYYFGGVTINFEIDKQNAMSALETCKKAVAGLESIDRVNLVLIHSLALGDLDVGDLAKQITIVSDPGKKFLSLFFKHEPTNHTVPWTPLLYSGVIISAIDGKIARARPLDLNRALVESAIDQAMDGEAGEFDPTSA